MNNRPESITQKDRICDSCAVALETKIDSSDYILLSVNIIENRLSQNSLKQLEKELQSIKELYANNDYQSAIKKLVAIVNQYKNELGPEYSNLLLQKSTNLVDNPSRNYSRRVFETELANNFEVKFAAENNYPLFNDFANFLRLDIGPIDSRSKVDQMLNLSKFNDYVELELKEHSNQYKKKDRDLKGGSDKSALDTVSRNPGIMVSSQPNYRDNIADDNVESRVPDRFVLDNSKPGFSADRPHVPLVGSISGTAFSLAALLEDYMSENKKKPTLQKDVNVIVKEFIRVYIKSGYHSYGEISAVLAEPHIQRIFNNYNVKLDKMPQDCIDESFKAAQRYALVTKLKSAVHDDISHRSQPNYRQIKREFADLKAVVDQVLNLEAENLMGPKKVCMDRLRKELKEAEEKIENGSVTDIDSIKKPLHKAMEDLFNVSTAKHEAQLVHQIGSFMNFSLGESKVSKAAKLALSKLKPEIPVFSSQQYVMTKLSDQYMMQNHKIPNATFISFRENNAHPGQLVVDFFVTDASGKPTPMVINGAKRDSFSINYVYDKQLGWVNLNKNPSLGGLNTISADTSWSKTNSAAMNSLLEISKKEFSEQCGESHGASLRVVTDTKSFASKPYVSFHDKKEVDQEANCNPHHR